LEGARRATGEAQRERDRQCEEKLDLLAKHETLQKREKRVEQHVANLEQRLLNSSMHSDNSASDAEERGSLQSVRFGLEMARQQLSALSARLQVATVRADQSELEQCRTELTEQHRTLALMARTLNSTRSSKRAVETGILESRLKEQLASLESNSNRMAEMYNYASHDSGRVAELDRLADQQRRQIDSLNHDKVALQTKIDELKIVNSRLHAQGDANVENFGLSSAQAMSRKQQKTYERYVRAESSRKALVYQKKYLLLIIGGFQETESNTLRLISRMGGHPEPNAIAPKIPPKSRFKSAVRVVIAIQRLKFLTKKWQKTVTRSRSSSKEVVSGAFSLANGHRLSRPLMEYGKY
jgi:pericentrin